MKLPSLSILCLCLVLFSGCITRPPSNKEVEKMREEEKEEAVKREEFLKNNPCERECTSNIHGWSSDNVAQLEVARMECVQSCRFRKVLEGCCNCDSIKKTLILNEIQ